MTSRQTEGLERFNRARAGQAATRDARLAALALRSADLSDGQHKVAEARVQHPGACWADVARAIGMTKAQAASHMRRIRRLVGDDE